VKISIPKLSFVVLIGPTGSGKTTFAPKHFLRIPANSLPMVRRPPVRLVFSFPAG
jgi:predicted kinase